MGLAVAPERPPFLYSLALEGAVPIKLEFHRELQKISNDWPQGKEPLNT